MPLQVIEAFDNQPVELVLEDVRLDRVEVLLELGDDGLEVIDNEVQQRIQGKAWALGGTLVLISQRSRTCA